MILFSYIKALKNNVYRDRKYGIELSKTRINSSQRKKDEQINGKMDEWTKIRIVIGNEEEGVRGNTVYDFPCRLGASQVT